MRRVKGGMGSLSEALCRSIADKGGEVRMKTPVRRILVEGRPRDRRRAARRDPHHGARGDLEPRQTGDALRAGGARASRRCDDPARRAHRASRRLHAPALQALAPAELRPAVRAPQRRPAHALQHDAGSRSRAPAGELRGVPARRAARAPGGRDADPDRDGPEPRARGLPHRHDLRLLLPVRRAARGARQAARRDGGAHSRSPLRVPARPARLHRRARGLLVGSLRRDAGRHQRRLHARPDPSRADDRRAGSWFRAPRTRRRSPVSTSAVPPAIPARA